MQPFDAAHHSGPPLYNDPWGGETLGTPAVGETQLCLFIQSFVSIFCHWHSSGGRFNQPQLLGVLFGGDWSLSPGMWCQEGVLGLENRPTLRVKSWRRMAGNHLLEAFMLMVKPMSPVICLGTSQMAETAFGDLIVLFQCQLGVSPFRAMEVRIRGAIERRVRMNSWMLYHMPRQRLFSSDSGRHIAAKSWNLEPLIWQLAPWSQDLLTKAIGAGTTRLRFL